MSLLKSLCVALSTYSIIPMPRLVWDEKSTGYSLALFPLVGLFIAGLLCGWYALCRYAHIGSLLFAAVATTLPILVSGGIHFDGFMDTIDALASHQSREKKLMILRDSHVGAFAVIYAVLYLLVSFGLFSELMETGLLPLVAASYVLSRALSALTAQLLPKARPEGMLAALLLAAQKRPIILSLVLLTAVLVFMLYWNLPAALLCMFVQGFWLFSYRRLVLHNFGGVTGDSSGFFLQISEWLSLLSLLVFAIINRCYR